MSGEHAYGSAPTRLPLAEPADTISAVAEALAARMDGCIFCAIAAQKAEASVVYQDETVVVFMDLNPVAPGHLLVVPRKHAVGLEDVDEATSAHVWSVGRQMAQALRRSGCAAMGINVLLADGEVAFQEVFRFSPARDP